MINKNNMPTVGIVSYRNPDGNFFGAETSYLHWISSFGNPRIIMPWEEFVPDIDLLVLPGGLDARNEFGLPSFKNTNTDVFKQFFYDNRLEKYIENQTPIFGICLGAQMLMQHFGSVITQHLQGHNYHSEPRSELVHNAVVFDDGKIRKNNGNPVTVKVNSLHHQGVYLSNLNDSLQIMLGHKEGTDYIVEAFRHKTLPIAGVQFHPENLFDKYTFSLIKMLLKEKYELQN